MSTADTGSLAAPPRSPSITAASVLFFVFGIGILATHIPAAIFTMQTRAFPLILGIPLFGKSYSERLGIDFTIRASLVFDIVNALELLAGYWLWKSDRRGGVLALSLLPFGVFFWVLFELPIPLVLGPLRAVAVAAGWKSLR